MRCSKCSYEHLLPCPSRREQSKNFSRLTASSKVGGLRLVNFEPPHRRNSLPQLGQVRCGCVFMGLTALRPQSGPKRCTTLHRVVPNRRARLLAICRPVPRAIACSLILACQIPFQNKIPVARLLRRSMLITTFKNGGGSKLTAVNHRLSR
jgi:hypothetical protein